jgi:hypothetical protein
MKSKMPLVIFIVLLLLCAFGVAWFLKSRRAKTPNMAPIAALHLDSIDETKRVVVLSDGGSRDPEGTLQSWRIAWGDGKEEHLSSIPKNASHTYAEEGEYTISLWCIDNLGATSSLPAKTNITFDLLKRQKALEQAQAEGEAKREADRLKADAARKEAERLEQERQKKELAALEAQKARELEEKRKAEAAELARKKAKEATATPITDLPAPLAAALLDDSSSRKVIYTPPDYLLGDFQISKEKNEGLGKDGNILVILATRCVNFPETPVVTSNWHIDGKDVQVRAGRIRASLPPGKHEVTAIFTRKSDSQPTELKADVIARTNGECFVVPKK